MLDGGVNRNRPKVDRSRKATKGGKLPISEKRMEKQLSKEVKKKGPEALKSKKLTARETVKVKDSQYALQKLQNDFLKLSEKVETKFGELESTLLDLRRQLVTGGKAQIPEEVIYEVTQLLEEAMDVREDLMAAVVNNLRIMHKVVGLMSKSKKEGLTLNDPSIKKMRDNLELVQGVFDSILSKRLSDFTHKDLDRLKDGIDLLRVEMALLKESPRYEELSLEDRKRFDKQWEHFDAMVQVFDSAEKLWKGEQAGEGKVEESMKAVMDEGKNEAKFWGSVAAVLGVLAVGIIITALLLGLMVLSGGFIGSVIAIGIVVSLPLLAAAGKFAIKAYEAANEDYDAIRKRLKAYFDATAGMMKLLER